MSPFERIETKDGSWTGFNDTVEEHYHNLAGAYTEALNVYVNPTEFERRLDTSDEIVVLDPFLGLGYNLLTCIQQFIRLKKRTHSHARLVAVAFENDPQVLGCIPQVLEEKTYDDLKEFLPAFAHNIYYQTQQGSSLKYDAFQEVGVDLTIHVGDTRQLVKGIPDGSIDVIYHDAFSTRKQPELWTSQLFQHYARILKPGRGTILTYSGASPPRKAFLDCGFYVYRLVTPTGKPCTLATLEERTDVSPLTPLEIALLDSKSGITFEDNDELSLSKDEILTIRQKKYDASSRPGSCEIYRQYK
jgi:tRNA U34 5-methylaminomethyl-2-thiouridine-forming methyltransferase MnmC